MEKLVVIIDKVPEYGKRLAVFLNSERNFPYRAVVLSSVEEAEGYLKSDGVYAVLVAEELEASVVKLLAGTSIKLFCLCENTEERAPFCLYRYCSAKELEQCLVEVKTIRKKVPVIGFFSPAGGCETEVLAGKTAEELGRKGRVLYLSLFPFSIEARDREDGLSEALYYLRQEGGSRREQVQGVLRCGEYMDVIGPARWYTDLRYVTKEDFGKLLQSELWNREYRAFFVAVGMFDCVGQDILNCCDSILMPVWETAHGRAVQEEFRRQMKESGETKLYSGIREFSVKVTGGVALEEAVKEAVQKGEEILGEYNGGDSQTDVGTVGFIRRIDG